MEVIRLRTPSCKWLLAKSPKYSKMWVQASVVGIVSYGLGRSCTPQLSEWTLTCGETWVNAGMGLP